MDLDLTLSALKFANVSTFSRTFGTKKNGSQNGGSLTTEEFNIANAIPFDKMRPIEITENSRTGNVEFDANLVINQSNVTLTINDGTYKGVKVNVFAQTAGNVVHDTNVTDSLQAGERASYQWNGTGWDYVGGTPLGALNYTALCSTALGTAKAVSIPGFTLKTGTTIEVLFANGFYGSASSDAMTLNVNSIGAKKIYACRHGSKIALAPHSCTRDESGDATAHYWFIQANTCLKLMYDETLDSNAGGWLILGNPVVLSASDTNSSYTVYADGSINQKSWKKIFDNPTKTAVNTVTFDENITNYNEIMIVVTRINSGKVTTPYIFPVSLIQTLTGTEQIGLVSFSSDYMYMHYTDAYTITRDSSSNITVYSAYVR